MSDRRRGFAQTWLLLAALASVGCSSPRPQLGGETHWLRSCWSDDECGDALSCICGSCTRTCHEDDSCAGGRPAACYEQDSPLLLQRCAGNSPDVKAAAGVCLPLCANDDQCSGGKRCEEGACVPAESTADAGKALDASSVRTGPGRTISDFDDVEVDVPAEGEVTLPKLSTTIDGADAQSLVGTWHGQDCEPPDGDPTAPSCPQLVISEDASGEVSGFLQFSNGPLPPPFPPASDPDVGYPPGLSAAEVNELRINPRSGPHYPLRDARFEDGVLTFKWSVKDLFEDWCELQTAQPWTIEGHTFYFCGPQDPAQLAALDPVKRSLCVSAQRGPWCVAADGIELPCPCLLDNSPQCTVAVCRCDHGGCEADTRSQASMATFSVAGDTMSGGWAAWTNTAPLGSSRVFEREVR
jgi:hypothetical protein